MNILKEGAIQIVYITSVIIIIFIYHMEYMLMHSETFPST